MIVPGEEPPALARIGIRVADAERIEGDALRIEHPEYIMVGMEQQLRRIAEGRIAREPRLRQLNGQASIREILAASIKFHRSKRVRLVVDHNPPEGLIDVIFGCLYLASDHSNPKRPWRTSIYASSSIQTPGFSTMLVEQIVRAHV